MDVQTKLALKLAPVQLVSFRVVIAHQQYLWEADLAYKGFERATRGKMDNPVTVLDWSDIATAIAKELRQVRLLLLAQPFVAGLPPKARHQIADRHFRLRQVVTDSPMNEAESALVDYGIVKLLTLNGNSWLLDGEPEAIEATITAARFIF